MTRAVRFQGPGPGIRIGRLEDDAVWDAGPASAVGFVPTAEAWQSVRGASGACFRPDEVTLLAPVVPPKLLCIGLNYRLHAEETGSAIPTEPVLFCKLPNSYSGPDETIVLPKDDATPDYEAEMALVIGTRTRRADRAAARAAIGGITAVNDVSARTAQRSSGGQFIRGKSYDTFAPLGPCIAAGVDHRGSAGIGIEGWVNGQRRQASTTAQLVFSIDYLIAYITNVMTLLPGDVVATGTPSGVGPLQPGDEVTITVAGVGELTNPVGGTS